MSYLIETTNVTGLTVYAVIHGGGKVWNAMTSAFENFSSGNWANYAVALSEQGASGYYSAAYPSGISGLLTTEALYSQAGGSPAISDAPSIGLGQSQGSAVADVNGVTAVAKNFQANLGGMIIGAAVTGTLSTTQMSTNLPDTTNGVYNGRLVLWTSGALIRQIAYISAYNGTTQTLTFGAVTAAPSAGDSFIIV